MVDQMMQWVVSVKQSKKNMIIQFLFPLFHIPFEV